MDQDFRIITSLEWRTRLPSAPLTSPTFSLLGSEWNFRISRTGNDTYPEYGHFYTYTVSLIPKRNQRKSVEDSLQTPLSVGTYANSTVDPSAGPVGWQWSEITGRSEVDIWNKQFSSSHSFVILEKVQFVCMFYGADPKTEAEILDVQVSSEVPRDIELLSSDLSHLLEQEVLPDVRLECGGLTFQAHRSILAARSQVFRAMFQSGMLESVTGAVKVQDLDVGVLEKLLRYVYTGKPEDISESNAADLYEAADKYNVHSLKKACTYWIERNLTEENCVKYLMVADSHSDRDLKAAVVTFILENPRVLKSEDWVTFSKELPSLANEVLLAFVASTVH